MPEYVMGHVRDRPTAEDLAASPAGQMMQAYKEYVDENCKGCSHIRYCRGGCPYNAIAPTGGEIRGVDPHCPAYTRIFDEINSRLNAEMFEGPSMMEMNPFASRRRRETKPGIMALMHRIVMR